MKISDLQDKSVEELNTTLISLREEQFKLNMKHSTGQLGQTHLLKENRTDIARIKTLLTQKAGNQ